MPYQPNFVEEHLKETKKFKASLAGIYKQRQATSNECRAKQHNSSSERQRVQNNYPTNNPVAKTVQEGATASGPDTDNVSETSSAKQRRKERMKKFDIEFKTKRQLEQALLKWRKLELDIQMKELKTKHHLLEEKV